MPVRYFENIQAKPDKDTILFRLGYKKGKTELNEHDSVKISTAITMGLSLCGIKGAYGTFRIKNNNCSVVELENGTVFKSAKLAELLKNSAEVVLLASTAGNAVVERRDKEMNENNASLGVILDAVASETADAGLDWLEKYLNTTLRRQGKTLTKRFSPGYGGLELFAQKDIYELLSLERLGIRITEKFILIPEKSVFAIAGISS